MLGHPIPTATAKDMEELVTFWVCEPILPQLLYVEVSACVKMPTAYTCMVTIKLLAHYTNYMDQTDLKARVSVNYSGFGLV